MPRRPHRVNDESVLPDRAADDLDDAWGDRESWSDREAEDERLERERPPHWG